MKTLVNDCIKLGFGLMRLPREAGADPVTGPIDVEQTKRMVDDFLAAGGKYFDTAFIYPGSEEVTREALVRRHPRESYYLATKLHAASWAAKDEAAAKDEIFRSLERTGCGYFDFYLLHSITEENLRFYDDYGLWDYVKGLKAKGLVRHWGFSFHDKAEFLDRLLTDHPDAEFVQLQINYADWEDSTVQSRANYEVCVKHGVPVVVMEPVKGNVLANPPPSVAEIFRASDPDASAASWAIRFAASLPQTMMVLSGMSTEDQMKDNLSYMRSFRPLSDGEAATVEAARKALLEVDRIPCTGCNYCTKGCPKKIRIPEIFWTMNIYKQFDDLARARFDYTWRPAGTKASDCVACGQCERACPQHLKVVSLLKECAATLE